MRVVAATLIVFAWMCAGLALLTYSRGSSSFVRYVVFGTFVIVMVASVYVGWVLRRLYLRDGS